MILELAHNISVIWPNLSDKLIQFVLSDKLTQLSVPTSICQWITSFLTDRQQLVRLGKLTFRTLTISTGAPQGCVLSPLFFSLYTNDCTSKDPSVKLLKFADDTTVIGLIKDGDESAYRQEVEQLAVWCSLNNLEMIVDFRRNPPALPPLTIMNSTVTAVESFRFLGTTISQDLKWDNHIDSIAKDHWAQPDTRIFFSPRPYPTWTTHNTPRYCTSVNNSSNLHLYIGHMHIHSSVYGHFSFCIFFIAIVILNYCLFSSLLVFFITLIICCLCLHCCLFVLYCFCTGSS